MRTFLHSLKTSCIALCLLTILLGILYPLLVFGIGQVFFRKESMGSLVTNKEGKVIGSALIGQNFSAPGYFHPRPSAAQYNGASSTGSNLGPSSSKLIETLSRRVAQYKEENHLPPDAILPAETVTSSGSGLDPHISAANAYLQASRVAAARKMSDEEVLKMIAERIETPLLGLFGTRRVNVLLLNLDLDAKD